MNDELQDIFDKFEHDGPPFNGTQAKIQYEGFRDYFLPLLKEREASRDQQIALDAQETLLKEIALDDKYRSVDFHILISRNAIIKKLKEVRATLKAKGEKS